MVVEKENNRKRRIRTSAIRILKAAVKAAIVCIVYIILTRLLEPISTFIPGLPQMIETFVIVYIALMVIGDLTSGTIFQHVFSTAKALFVMAYLILALNTGILEYSYGNVDLIIDLRLFLVVVMLLELLGLAKSLVQAINYVSEKAELTRIRT